MTHVLRLGLVVTLSCALALSGCGGDESKSGTLVGPVTSVGDGRVCVGGPAGSGDCFAKNATTSGLKVADCVRVTYSSGGSSAPSTAAKVQRLNPADHANVCPAK